MHINIDTDTWFLNSVFAHLELASELVGHMDDPTVADELTKSINELRHKVADLLAKPYSLQPSENPDSLRASGGSVNDEDGYEESGESDFADMLDDLHDSAARADAFTNAAKSLVNELAAEEECGKRQLAELAHLVSATSEAMLEVTDLVRVFGQRLSKRDSAS